MEFFKLINAIFAFENSISIEYNINEKYNAASCIKKFILVELFNQINKGIINKKEELTYKENIQ